MPNVAGAIDCTHFQLRSPDGGPRRADYLDRERNFSIVDAGSRFLHITSGIPGSVHDSRILSESSLYAAATRAVNPVLSAPLLEVGEEGTIIRPYILGDAGYPLLSWLLTPYPGSRATMGAVHWRYNYLQSSARMVVECAFGLLKNRFRLLDGIIQVRNVARATDMITAACILHNICIASRDEALPEFEAMDFVEDLNEVYPPPDHVSTSAAGQAARNALAEQIFNR